MALRDRIAQLLGISTFAESTAATEAQLHIDDESVENIRRAHGGQLAPLPRSRTRWYLRDLESAERNADNGILTLAALLMRSARKDGVYSGVLSTRTDGLVRLPKRFRGNAEIIGALEKGNDGTRSVFDEMHPPAELALLAKDGIELGVGVAELVPVEGRDYPVLVRLEPEFLSYTWSENQWYFRSIAGRIAVNPGDGRWVLHIPGGRMAPWQNGLWRAIGRAYIRKEHASFYRDNWQAKLANAARIATSPQAGSQEQKDGWFAKVAAWGVNTVFSVTPGYEVSLLESNGRGHESFKETIADQNQELIIAVAGQTVTTDGGAGFANADIHKSIRADLIQATAESLAHTINTQSLPWYIVENFGEAALDDPATMEWDVTPPKDRTAEATSLTQASNAMEQLTKALGTHGMKLDAESFAIQFGIPVARDEDKETVADVTFTQALDLATQKGMQPTEATVISLTDRLGIKLESIPEGGEQPLSIELAPTDVAKVVKAGEARRAQGLPIFGDERDEKTITEMGEGAAAQAGATADVEVVEAEAETEVETAEATAEGVA